MQNSKFKIQNFGICLVIGIWLLGFALKADAASTSLDPTRLGVGARSLAMGRTNVVAPGDINALFVNPANAAYLASWAATSMYTSLMEGEIKYTLLGGAIKLRGGGAGVAYLGGSSSGIDITTRDADSRVGSTGSSMDYSNTTLTFAYGKEIRSNLSAGGSLKLFSKGFSGQSTGTGFDMDIGLLYKLRDTLSLGLTFKNILPDGVGGLNWGANTKEDVPMEIKGGLSYNLRENLLLNADLDLLPVALHSGVEWRPLSTLALRGGFEQMPTGNSSSVINFGIGVGLNFREVNFDYAYYRDGALDANSTHFLTLSYAPQAPKPKVIEKPKPKVELVPPPALKPIVPLVKPITSEPTKEVKKPAPKPKPKPKPKKKK